MPRSLQEILHPPPRRIQRLNGAPRVPPPPPLRDLAAATRRQFSAQPSRATHSEKRFVGYFSVDGSRLTVELSDLVYAQYFQRDWERDTLIQIALPPTLLEAGYEFHCRWESVDHYPYRSATSKVRLRIRFPIVTVPAGS